jgi:chaperonin GroEL
VSVSCVQLVIRLRAGEVLSTLVLNKIRGVLDVVAIKAPSFGERRKNYLEDMSIATGATFISEDLGMNFESLNDSMLGRCERVVVGKDSTTIITHNQFKDAINDRVAQIKATAQETKSDYDKDKLLERAAALGGGIARIKVGAATEVELKDKKLRYEDAINSVKSALEMGVVPGGGSCMLHMSCDSVLKNNILAKCVDDDEKLGVEIVFKSLCAPMRQIVRNAGKEGEVIVDKVRNTAFGFGYNAQTDKYEDLLVSGVLDPAKVTINALENSASMAALVLTTEVLVTEIPKKEVSSGGGGGMGGDMDYDM